MKCLIVDDEPIARKILENYCAFLPEIEVLASCSNALEAKRVIQNKLPDLIFLDINMPVLDGLSFMKTLAKPPLVVFTTAYKEFAHEAFDLAACDYLLKPFSLERFIIAVDKAREKLEPKNKVTEAVPAENFTYLKSEGKIYKINFEEILFAEAWGNSVKIVTNNGVIKPAITFTALEELLPKPLFIRLHRSFIINKNKIGHIEGNRVFIGSTEVPIGANYKEHFFRELGIK
ncbi:LytR/AlgR family response regulator transcription factor [Chitinophaga rupis]|nr:LytTR family DNA-binding domain-containing protein [Chitinophaga rupis]